VPARPALVTLLTDYGLADSFVGVLHGVIAGICPQARVIDVSHGVPRQDVRGGALALAQAIPYMPVGVHVAIVDPTVGRRRRAVAVAAGDGRLFVGPDNGLLWPAVELSGGVVGVVEISRSPWRLAPVSATFHGRDIFAPVAAHLAAGAPLAQAGDALAGDALERLVIPSPRVQAGALSATVGGVDGFGNVQLAAAAEHLQALECQPGDSVLISTASGAKLAATLARSFADVAPGQALVFVDSAGQVAIALNLASAAARLGLSVGDEVRLSAGSTP
jgi:S-adenosylmethionine hydrolase